MASNGLGESIMLDPYHLLSSRAIHSVLHMNLTKRLLGFSRDDHVKFNVLCAKAYPSQCSKMKTFYHEPVSAGEGFLELLQLIDS